MTMEIINYNETAAATVEKINRNFSSASVETSDKQEVFLGNLVQDGTWVKQSCIVVPVALGVTYNFILPSGYKAKVHYGTTSSPNTASGELSNGDTFTMPANAFTQRIAFTKTGGLLVEDAVELISDGAIKVECIDLDVRVRNANKENLLAAIKRTKVLDRIDGGTAVYSNVPCIAHISDLHGDAQRAYNFFKYCKFYGIDDAVVSGDSVLYTGADGCSFVYAAAKKAGVHADLVMGNHEMYFYGTSPFATYIGSNASVMGYLKSAGVTTDKCYYYYDVPNKPLRIIVLDQYEGVYGGSGQGGKITQDQFDWFINTLKSTPDGYGIIVAMHSQETALKNEYDKFKSTYSAYAVNGFYVSESRPIRNIIDAFISRTSYSEAITASYGTLNIDADFSSISTTAKFVCYLVGHRHADHIGYASGATNNQLVISITSGNGLIDPVSGTSNYELSGWDDLPREGKGVSQDAFNVLAVDLANNKVRLMRVGSDVTRQFNKRDYLVADF